jgi:hypothetical protein
MKRHRKILGPDVFAECEKRVVPPQIFDCRFHTFVDLDLLNAGVALDVKNAIGNEQVVVEFLRATNVQDCVRIAIELPNFLQRHAGSWSVGQVARAIRPAIFEIKLARQPSENFCCVLELVGDLECFRIVRKARRVFDVENVVPEPLQSHDIMNVLPDDARDRHRAHEPHYQDALALHSAVIKTLCSTQKVWMPRGKKS